MGIASKRVASVWIASMEIAIVRSLINGVFFAHFEMFWNARAQAFCHHTEKVVVVVKRSNHLHLVDSVTPRCLY